MLHEFIASDLDEIITRCRTKVVTSSVPPPTEAEIDHALRVFLEQLAAALRLGGYATLTVRSTRPRGRLRRSETSRQHMEHGHRATGHVRVICNGCGGVAYECRCHDVEKVVTQGVSPDTKADRRVGTDRAAAPRPHEFTYI